MSDKTKIEWADATWNPVTGCTKVSPGCDHCYIDRTPPFRIAGRTFDGPGAGATTGVLLHPERLDQPLRWQRPRRVCVNSLSDLFHDEVPDEYIARVWAVMALAPQHRFMVLTKRHGRMRSLLSSPSFPELVTVWMWRLQSGGALRRTRPHSVMPMPLPNVWIGVTVEDEAGVPFFFKQWGDGSLWVDRLGDVWAHRDNGLMESFETAPFPREHVEKKWGPLKQLSKRGAGRELDGRTWDEEPS